MMTLEMVLESPLHMQAKGNADEVLVSADVLPGLPGLVWLSEVPTGGALVHAVRWQGYAMTGSDLLGHAARFCAVLKAMPKALYLDGQQVEAVFQDGLARLVPVKTDVDEAPERR